MRRGRPSAPVSAQSFSFSGAPRPSAGNSTGSIIWPIIPSAHTITGLRYVSASSNASVMRSTASCTDDGARTITS